MSGRTIRLLCAAVAVLSGARAETIDGVITVKRRLTKQRVTATLPLYQRGPAVELGSNREEDPLALERGRVVVYLEGRHPAPEVTATLHQQNRRFEPELIVIPAGSKVSFPNFDPIFHNVFSLSKARSFDLGNYAKGETRLVRFDEPGVVFVNCHLHPNMSAAIVVAPNQWNARVSRDGRYALSGVPPGNYTIVAWHKAAGYLRRQIEVVAGRGTKVDFLVPLDDDPPASTR